jgi:hypothetical protein
MFSSDMYALNIETLIWEKLPSEVFTGAGTAGGRGEGSCCERDGIEGGSGAIPPYGKRHLVPSVLGRSAD